MSEITQHPPEVLPVFVERLEPLVPLTRHQMAVAAVLSEGYGISTTARLLGVERSTVAYHIQQAADRLPGNLPPTARLVCWYRGASASVLGVRHPHDAPSKQRTIKLALLVREWRRCPSCGYRDAQEVLPNGTTASRDSRST